MEIIPAPDIFIAAAARRTSRISLGSGVVSLSYHNPFLVAERFATLDHLTHGRLVMGIGPGSLPQDAMMMGINPSDQRRRMEESIEVILELLRGDAPVTRETDWFALRGASLQFAPYSDFEIGVVCVVSPSGPSLAGRYGLSMISASATTATGFAALERQMSIAEESAQRHSAPPPRRESWRLVGPMHLAETRAQAEAEATYGIEEMVKQWLRTTEVWTAATGAPSRYQANKTAIEMIRNGGVGVIGTPEDAIAQILRLREQSGEFGTYLLMGHEWASPEATKRSLRLFAEYVIPAVNKASETKVASQRSFFEHIEEGKVAGARAVREAIDKYENTVTGSAAEASVSPLPDTEDTTVSQPNPPTGPVSPTVAAPSQDTREQ